MHAFAETTREEYLVNMIEAYGLLLRLETAVPEVQTSIADNCHFFTIETRMGRQA